MIWNLLASASSSAIQAIVGMFARVVGSVLSGIAGAILHFVMNDLLGNILFAPISLQGGSGFLSGLIGGAFETAWHFMLAASGGVALVSLTWGALRLHLRGGGEARREIVEGLVNYVAVVVGGLLFITTILNLTNQITQDLYQMTQGFSGNILTFSETALGATGVAVAASSLFLSDLVFPLALLLFAVVFLWAVVQWVFRVVDLLFFTVMLPVTAAISIGGPKRAFQWNFQEVVGALFYQTAMAVAWWLAYLVMHTGFGLPEAATSVSDALLTLLIAIPMFLLVARAPSFLRNISGHQESGVAGTAMGFAVGSLLAQGVRSTARMTPVGAGIGLLTQARQTRARASFAALADKATAGEALATTPFGKAAHRVGEAVKESSVGQTVESLAASVEERREAVLGSSPFYREGYEKISAPFRFAGKGVTFARTLGSALYQPGVTLGRSVRAALETTQGAEFTLASERVEAAQELFARRYRAAHPDATDEQAKAYGEYMAALTHGGVRGGTATETVPTRIGAKGQAPPPPEEVAFDQAMLARIREYRSGWRAGAQAPPLQSRQSPPAGGTPPGAGPQPPIPPPRPTPPPPAAPPPPSVTPPSGFIPPPAKPPIVEPPKGGGGTSNSGGDQGDSTSS